MGPICTSGYLTYERTSVCSTTVGGGRGMGGGGEGALMPGGNGGSGANCMR